MGGVRGGDGVRGRGGSVYVAVLGVTSILTLTAVAGVVALRAHRASSAGSVSLDRTRGAAELGVGLAMLEMSEDDGWRSVSGGVVVDGRSVPGGSEVTVTAEDEDGSLTDWGGDEVVLTSVARSVDAVQAVSVELEAVPRGARSLASAVHAGGMLEIEANAMTSDRVLSSNTMVLVKGKDDSTTSPMVVRARGWETAVTSHALPDYGAGVKELLEIATEIDYADLDDGELEEVWLSAVHNPYGETNEFGVYAIDAEGGKIRIEDAAIVGTLVIVNAHRVELKGSVSWEPARPDMPALVTMGDCRIDMNSDEVEIDTDDGELLFASGLSGLFAVAGDLRVLKEVTLGGTLSVGGDCEIGKEMTITEWSVDPEREPPVGFVGRYEMGVIEGTWRRVMP